MASWHRSTLLASSVAAAVIAIPIDRGIAHYTRSVEDRLGLSRAIPRREAAGLALAGIALGSAGALAGARLARGLLFGVEPTDPLTFGSVALLLLAVTITAALVPAARAAGVQPVETLRSD